MMLALALVQAAVAPMPAPADEVVVIGERLKKWTGKVTTTIGITSCRTTVSTGDAEIDAVGCTALKRCWSTYRPRVAIANDRKRPVEERRAAGQGVTAELGACLKRERDTLVAALVERRAGAKARS